MNIDDMVKTPGIEYFIVCPPAPNCVTTSFGDEWATYSIINTMMVISGSLVMAVVF